MIPLRRPVKTRQIHCSRDARDKRLNNAGNVKRLRLDFHDPNVVRLTLHIAYLEVTCEKHQIPNVPYLLPLVARPFQKILLRHLHLHHHCAKEHPKVVSLIHSAGRYFDTIGRVAFEELDVFQSREDLSNKLTSQASLIND